MRVLLLHPEDELPRSVESGRWDVVVDFGRAPASTYTGWSHRAGCRAISLYDFGVEVEDLYQTRKLLQLGMGRLIDEFGIDWWDVLSLEVASQMQQLMLVHRLAENLPPGTEFFASRPFALAGVLQKLCGGTLLSLAKGPGSALRSLRHYSQAWSKLNLTQIVQVLQDKFDPKHELRRRFRKREPNSGNPVVLLPSAYISVSRMAVSYASLLPDIQFLLVCARSSGELKSPPPNVRMISLDPYFASVDESRTKELLKTWNALRVDLIRDASEFASAQEVGVLGRVPALIRWGTVLRTAWNQVFESENIAACLCADDSNPYTRIPLILAGTKAIPALACHHGALDAWTAVKTQHCDFYLAKGEMERDYLVRTCRVAPRQIVLGAPAASNASSIKTREPEDRPWLVYFTEAYHSAGWRSDEVYGELLPKLLALAHTCKLELVFKLHPFESVEGHRRLLRRFLPKAEAARIHVLDGPPSHELWLRTRFALTGQSTVAVDCATRGIPVFLCAWLRDSYTGYLRQYARFGIGYSLESAEQIAGIPELLESQWPELPPKNRLRQTIDPGTLRELLSAPAVAPLAAQG